MTGIAIALGLIAQGLVFMWHRNPILGLCSFAGIAVGLIILGFSI